LNQCINKETNQKAYKLNSIEDSIISSAPEPKAISIFPLSLENVSNGGTLKPTLLQLLAYQLMMMTETINRGSIVYFFLFWTTWSDFGAHWC
jgi:hypothetical protein